MLETKQPREQSGRDSFSRYRAQVRSAAMATLSILNGKEVDRVYCDLHDDFVVRLNKNNKYSYIFFQVKTKGKQNHNWSINELLGISSRVKDKTKHDANKIKNSFIGKLLLHTTVFENHCNSIVFQTNINNSDGVDKLISDISNGKFENINVVILIEKFNDCFAPDIGKVYSVKEIKEKISKLKFETDIQYLKEGDKNFEPSAREVIREYSEIDLSYTESKEILMKLLELVEKKSSGTIENLTKESIEKFAGISIDDLLSILSISKNAYRTLLKNGDSSAIKNVSMIQRILAGSSGEHVEYCSRCKSDWDFWIRNNRLTIAEFDLTLIVSKVRFLLEKHSNGAIDFKDFGPRIKELILELKNENILFDLTPDHILGAVISELIKRSI